MNNLSYRNSYSNNNKMIIVNLSSLCSNNNLNNCLNLYKILRNKS